MSQLRSGFPSLELVLAFVVLPRDVLVCIHSFPYPMGVRGSVFRKGSSVRGASCGRPHVHACICCQCERFSFIANPSLPHLPAYTPATHIGCTHRTHVFAHTSITLIRHKAMLRTHVSQLLPLPSSTSCVAMRLRWTLRQVTSAALHCCGAQLGSAMVLPCPHPRWRLQLCPQRSEVRPLALSTRALRLP